MIIDADVHLSPFNEYETNMSAEKLLASMAESGVDKAMCWVQRPYVRDQLGECLAYLYEATRRYPKQILGYGWIDPMLGLETARMHMKQCIEEYGFYGVKFNGCQNEHLIDDPHKVLPLVEELAKMNSTLAFHTGADDAERTHPNRLMRVAKLFPELKILMVHMGGAALSDLSLSAIEVAKACPNVTVIGSDIRTRSLERGIRELGAERICFGTDTPFEIMRVETAKYHALLSGLVTPEEKTAIMGGNIAKLLSLPV